MEKYLEEYSLWRSSSLPEDLSRELEAIEEDKEEIYDRFCHCIRFGTSGLRGKMGAGTNRINSVTLKKATLGVSEYLLGRYGGGCVVIGFDTRNNSREYARIVGEVLCQKGIRVFIFGEPAPVPMLSFAIRELKLNGGIMITASHNTKEYNGYKVYDRFGNQIDEGKAALMEELIADQDPFRELEGTLTGKIEKLPAFIKERYLEAIKANALFACDEEAHRKALGELKLCYTPLNGSGRDFVTTALSNIGIRKENLIPTSCQWKGDGNFPTCPSPNPENQEVFRQAILSAEASADKGNGEMAAKDMPDIIIATDPDCDRMGLALWDGETYVHLNGNQIGTLMFDYVCRNRVTREGVNSREKSDNIGVKRPIAFKSLVSTPLVEEMGKSYGVEVRNVFTGFKNIALEMEKLKEDEYFLFAFEESIGYLYGDYTRDKDGVMAAQLACLMAAEQRMLGSSLLERLEEIYRTYGYLETVTTSIYYKSEKDRVKMLDLLEAVCDGLLREKLKKHSLISDKCYHEQNMYMADFAGGHRVIIRPSGTELKLKIYIFARGETFGEAIDTGADIASSVREILNEGVQK